MKTMKYIASRASIIMDASASAARLVTVVIIGLLVMLTGATARATTQVFNPSISHYKVQDGDTNTCGPSGETLHYNHMVSAAYYSGKWYVMWTAHESSQEEEGNGVIYQSTASDSSLNSWSKAVVSFSDTNQSVNPVALAYTNTIRQWQPSLITNNTELWCFWNITAGGGADSYTTWFSKKTSGTAKWINTKMTFGGSQYYHIGGQGYHVMPGGYPVKISNGKILVPVYMQDKPQNTHHLFGVITVQPDGNSWTVSTVPMTAAQKAESLDGYENTVYETAPGHIVMLMRYIETNCPTSTVMHWAESLDYGQTWSDIDYVGLEMAAAGGSVRQVNGRFIASHIDHPIVFKDDGSLLNNGRYGAALFISRSGDPKSLVPGNCMTGPNYNYIGHPQMTIYSNKLYTVYSQGVEGDQNQGRYIWMSVMNASVETSRYVFPRSLASTRPDVWGGSLRFDRGQVVKCYNSVNIGAGDFSVGFKICPRQNGMLLDGRTDASPSTLCVNLVYDPAVDGFRPSMALGGLIYTTTTAFIKKGTDGYVGISVSNSAKKIRFTINGTVEQVMMNQSVALPAMNPWFGSKQLTGSSVVCYAGQMNQAWVYTRGLSDSEHQECRIGTAPASGLFVNLNTNTYTNSSFIIKTKEALVDTTYGDSIKRIVGQGSAGIEADAFNFSNGDMVDYHFSYKTSTPASNIVLFTLGDAEKPLRIELTTTGVVRVRSASITNTLCTNITTNWNLVSVIVKSELADIVCNGGEVVVKDSFNPRAFLGQGYYEQGLSDLPTFLVNMNDLCTTVTPFYAAAEVYLPFEGTAGGISAPPWKNAGICGQGESPSAVGLVSGAPTAITTAAGGIKGGTFNFSAATVLNPANTYFWGNAGAGETDLEAGLNGAVSLSGSMWIRHDTTPNLSRLFALGTMQLMVKTNGALSMTIDGTNWHDTATGTIPASAWRFIAFSYDGGSASNNLKIYVGDAWTTNLTLVGNFTDSAGALGTNQCLTIGNTAPAGSRPYPGKIDEFRLWSNFILSLDNFNTVRTLDLTQ